MVTWPDIFQDISLVEIRHRQVLVGELLQAWKFHESGHTEPSSFYEVMFKASVKLGFPASHANLYMEAVRLLSGLRLS